MSKNKYSKKKLMIYSITLIIIISAGVIATQLGVETDNTPSNNNEGDIYSSDPYGSASIPHDLFEPKTLNQTIEYYALNPEWNMLTQDYRPRWTGCTDMEYQQIFGGLPKMPQDFYKKYKMFTEGTLTDYDRLEPEYWMQPEFYGLDQKFFNRYMERWGENMWNIGQIGCKPSFRYVELKRGTTVQLSTFLHTEVIGTEAFLGAVVYVKYPEGAMNLQGTMVFTQPEDTSDYIKTRITSPDNNAIYTSEDFQERIKGLNNNINPSNRLLVFPATYRKVDVQGEKIIEGFSMNWCYKVSMEIKIEKDCPPGDYVVALDIMNPTSPVIEEYNWIVSSDPYYSFFYPAIREYKPEAPYFQVIITVV